ncbi:MAG: septum formation inhibitor Maf [Armatimonadetes bacterium]|nr:septum formation inhibitor Maf [Armatimonadota bacterium]
MPRGPRDAPGFEPPLILASRSPRRVGLLRRLVADFAVIPSHVPEEGDDPPVEFVRRLALAKAEEVAHAHPESIVVAADTVVVVDTERLGKPATPEAATGMLRRLSGRPHQVITGVAVVHAAREVRLVEHEVTAVTFRRLADEQIARYVAGGEPMDKAGAYAIQGGAAQFVERVEGDYDNVVGLPLARLRGMLARAGLWIR